MRYTYRTLLVLALLAGPTITASAEEATFEGFGDTSGFDIPAGAQNDETTPRSWRLTASYLLGEGLEPPQQVNSHRLDLRLQWDKLLAEKYFFSFDGKLLARLSGDALLGTGETVAADSRLYSLFLQTGNDRWGFKAGQQMVSLGKMDMLPVIDVLSPWDYSEFAFTAPEDSRISQPWLALTKHCGKCKTSLMVNLAPGINRYPPGLTSGVSVIDQPQAGKDLEAALVRNKAHGTYDDTWIVASVLIDDPVIDVIAPGPVLRASYPRYTLFGYSSNFSRGNFLWKIEGAYKNGLQVSDPAFQLHTANALQLAGGFDYTAGGSYTVSLEAGHQQLFAPTGSGIRGENTSLALRWSKNFRHETVSTVYYASYQIQDEVLTQATSLKYAFTDDVSLETVITLFQVGNPASVYAFLDRADQLAFRLNVSF